MLLATFVFRLRFFRPEQNTEFAKNTESAEEDALKQAVKATA